MRRPFCEYVSRLPRESGRKYLRGGLAARWEILIR